MRSNGFIFLLACAIVSCMDDDPTRAKAAPEFEEQCTDTNVGSTILCGMYGLQQFILPEIFNITTAMPGFPMPDLTERNHFLKMHYRMIEMWSTVHPSKMSCRAIEKRIGSYVLQIVHDLFSQMPDQPSETFMDFQGCAKRTNISSDEASERLILLMKCTNF